MPWVRYFEVPGMNHCGEGPVLEDFDRLTAGLYSRLLWATIPLASEFALIRATPASSP
jgi:hypothetical protein